ncbi:MAG: hypothetical protein K5931_10110 [Lachnospiraceae bacterium]|nr:hypothetical protein [Lachnospiraceae bacterium]
MDINNPLTKEDANTNEDRLNEMSSSDSEAAEEEKSSENDNAVNEVTVKEAAAVANEETVLINEAAASDESRENKSAAEEKRPSDIGSLLQVVRYPVSRGPQFVTRHPAKACCLAILLYSLLSGFYVLCLYHSLNQQLIQAFVALGKSVSLGLRNMSDEVLRLLEGSIIYFISQIPVYGDSISEGAKAYFSDYLELLIAYLSSETNNFLYELYPAINLPEALGFLTGLLTAFLGILLVALILKIFLAIAKHPFRGFANIFSLLSILCLIKMPFFFIASILGLFLPNAAMAIIPLASIFGMSYMCAVLFKGSDKRSEDRLVFVFPFILIFMMIVVLIIFAAKGTATGYSIYTRLMEFYKMLIASLY